MSAAVRSLLVALAGLALAGCVARVAWDVVTLPVDIASATVDVLTTSQSEADEKRGRALREADEKLGRQAKREARAEAKRLEAERRQAEREARTRRARDKPRRGD